MESTSKGERLIVLGEIFHRSWGEGKIEEIWSRGRWLRVVTIQAEGGVL